MFGIGMPELIVIFVIALMIFGPAELPKIAKNLGRLMADFKRTSDELMGQIQHELDAAADEPKPSVSPPDAVVATDDAMPTVAPSPPIESESAGGEIHAEGAVPRGSASESGSTAEGEAGPPEAHGPVAHTGETATAEPASAPGAPPMDVRQSA